MFEQNSYQIRKRTMRERGIRIRQARLLPRGQPEELTLGQRWPGTQWRKVDYSSNMTMWYHDSFPSTNGYNVHVTVVFDDQHGQNYNGRIDVHSTLWRGSNHSKLHYGWCVDNEGNEIWRDLNASDPNNKAVIAILHQFHYDKRELYSPKTYNRMRLPVVTSDILNL